MRRRASPSCRRGLKRLPCQRLFIEERKGTMLRTLESSLDFLVWPLWKDEFIVGKVRTGILAIDDDKALQTLSNQICELCSSYYEFDSNGQDCWFNEGQGKADKPPHARASGQAQRPHHGAKLRILRRGRPGGAARRGSVTRKLSERSQGPCRRGALHEGDGFAAITASSEAVGLIGAGPRERFCSVFVSLITF